MELYHPLGLILLPLGQDRQFGAKGKGVTLQFKREMRLSVGMTEQALAESCIGGSA